MATRLVPKNYHYPSIFEESIQTFRDRSYYDSIKEYCCTKNNDFFYLAEQNALCSFQEEEAMVQDDNFKINMNKLYTDKFSKKNSNVRKYYDEILLLSKNNICPYCLSRQVRSLDHFLPKSLYPSLSITGINLLPSCSDCNKDKSNSDEIYINYYFEDIDDECYLSCHPIFKEKDVIFDYRLDKPSTWDNDKFQRLSNQFNKTNLLKYYAEQAQIEFSRKQRSFIRLAHQPSSLENELKDLVSDEESVLGINSLQSALWRGLVLNVKELNSFLLKQELG